MKLILKAMYVVGLALTEVGCSGFTSQRIAPLGSEYGTEPLAEEAKPASPPRAPAKKRWAFTTPSPQTAVTVLNSSPCRVEVLMVGDENVEAVEPGGRLNFGTFGQTGDEFLLQAAAICDGQFIGTTHKRVCAPFITNRATAWILTKSQFSLEAKEPPMCQGPEPETYPYYRGDGYGSYRPRWQGARYYSDSRWQVRFRSK